MRFCIAFYKEDPTTKIKYGLLLTDFADRDKRKFLRRTTCAGAGRSMPWSDVAMLYACYAKLAREGRDYYSDKLLCREERERKR